VLERFDLPFSFARCLLDQLGFGPVLLSDAKLPILLLCRVVPNRREQPEAYRLYLELLGRYAVAPVYPERMENKDM
jgi:hypothetical protein